VPLGASTRSGRASARTRNVAARAGGLRLAWPRAWAPRLARDSGFIAHSPSARSLRMRAGTPAHPGRTWLIMPPIALSGENARAPQGLPRAQGGLQPARATSRPRRRASPCLADVQRSYRLSPIGYHLSPIGYHLSPIGYHLSAITYRLSAITYRLSAITYRLSAITYRLSAITYRLSAITYRLSPIASLSQTFQRIARITVTRHAVPIRNTICAVRSRVAFRRWRRPYIRCISVRLSF
jgi:hypothetical protein